VSLLDWLRRLGVLRFGAEAGVYHNALERPLSLQMGDVFDPQKDVISFDSPSADQAERSGLPGDRGDPLGSDGATKE
jgi:hypothetical protein